MPINIGNQIVSIKFYDPLDSHVVNARHLDIRQRGIYSGGHLRIVNDTHPGATVSLPPLICEIGDNTYQVKIETQSLISPIAVNTTDIYVVLRWTYTGNAAADYMLITAVQTPATNELIVGRCDFVANTLMGFTYSERNDPATPEHFLKVEATESGDSEPMKVWVKTGVIHTNARNYDIDHQKTPTSFTAPGANSKIGLVCIDPTSGIISIDDTGIAGAPPSAPAYLGRTVLAEITIAAGTTIITQSMIEDVRNFITVPTVPDGTTIEKSAAGLLQVRGGFLTDKGQSSQVVGTTNISNITGNWADMANMSITITTKGGNVLLLFSANFYVNSSTTVGLRFDVDGTPHHVLSRIGGGTGYIDEGASMQWLETSLAAGVHTFKVQWKDIRLTATQNGASFPRVFTAIELPK